MLRRSWTELVASPIRLSEIRWQWLLASGACYGLGMFCAAIFWHRVLGQLGLPVPAIRAYAAFFLSQLGKYLPGKAMVIVLRVGAIREPGFSVSLTVVSVFVETLTWMAVGAAIGCLALVAAGPQQTWLMGVGLMVAFVAMVAVSPPCLYRILKVLRRREMVATDRAAPRLTWGTVGLGWLLMTAGWILVAASLWFVMASFPLVELTGRDFWLILACATLSVVLGFASLIPGGLGVRELVIMPLLTGPFGAPVALAAAVLVRLVWMGTELLLAAIMKGYISRRRRLGKGTWSNERRRNASQTADDANLGNHSRVQ